MKLTVLTDNHTYIDRYYLGEPAVSYYIEDGDSKVLFDVGYSDVYVRNADAMGIDLTKIDALVLSHGHNDHTGGLTVFPESGHRIPLVAHPQVFEPKRDCGLMVSSPLSADQLISRFELRLTTEPVSVSEHLIYLGEIPRTNDFENQQPVGERDCGCGWEPDFVRDDSALVCIGDDGLSIITGCSHAGICNILSYARKITGIEQIARVIGGFHLFDPESIQLRETVEYFRHARIPQLYPCHCTSFAARAAIHRHCPVQEVGVGLTLQW